MGVKSFLLYRPADPGAPPAAADVEKLEKALEKLCARPVDKAKSIVGSCYILKQHSTRGIDPQVVAKPEVLHDVWLLQLAEAPARSFMLQRHMAQPRITEGDAQWRTFLERRLSYKPKPAVPMTLQGRTWAVGDGDSDFTVKLLQLGLANQAPLALVLEVEYAPVHYLDMGTPMLTALVAAIRAAVGPDGATRLEDICPAYAAYKDQLPEVHGPMHTAVAYGELVTRGLSRGRQQ